MELKIYSPQDNGFAQVVKWNFQELKAEISETVRDYEMAVYTDDTIKQARADRANSAAAAGVRWALRMWAS